VTLESLDAWWWPYLFILLAGWCATYPFRFLGVYLSGHIDENSDALVLVRAIATALIAAVIGNLIVFPTGALAASTLALRFGAAAAGFLAYLLIGRRVLVGIVVAEAVLIAGLWAGF
jgi:branched-subunit amino acid transport protein